MEEGNAFMNSQFLSSGDLVVFTGPVDDAGLSTFEGLCLNSNKYIRIKRGDVAIFLRYTSINPLSTTPQVVLFDGEPYFFRSESWSKAARS
jgi:hypothetical protein